VKHYEDKTETRTYKHLVKRTCDLCGREAKSSDWDGGCYDLNETTLKVVAKQKDGSNYPEGGYGNEYEIDLCPDCFRDRLVPWLQSQGAKITQQEWDW
jgi:predicted alpha/beta superfamily hydrolase